MPKTNKQTKTPQPVKKFDISITFQVTPREHHMARNTARGACKIVEDMLKGGCDFPDEVLVQAVNPDTGEGDTLKVSANEIF